MTISGCLFLRAWASSSRRDWAEGKVADAPVCADVCVSAGKVANDAPANNNQSRRRQAGKENEVSLEAMNCEPWTIAGFA